MAAGLVGAAKFVKPYASRKSLNVTGGGVCESVARQEVKQKAGRSVTCGSVAPILLRSFDFHYSLCDRGPKSYLTARWCVKIPSANVFQEKKKKKTLLALLSRKCMTCAKETKAVFTVGGCEERTKYVAKFSDGSPAKTRLNRNSGPEKEKAVTPTNILLTLDIFCTASFYSSCRFQV